MANINPIPTPESKSVSKTAIIVTTITNPFSQSVLNNLMILLILTNLKPITIKIAAKNVVKFKAGAELSSSVN